MKIVPDNVTKNLNQHHLLEFVSSFVDSHHFPPTQSRERTGLNRRSPGDHIQAGNIGIPIRVEIPRTANHRTFPNNNNENNGNNFGNEYLQGEKLINFNNPSPSAKFSKRTQIQQEDLENLNIHVQSPPPETISVE